MLAVDEPEPVIVEPAPVFVDDDSFNTVRGEDEGKPEVPEGELANSSPKEWFIYSLFLKIFF